MKGRYIKSILALTIGLGLLLAAVITYQFYSVAMKPMDVGSEKAVIEVKPHSSAKSLIYNLYEKGYIDRPRFLLVLIRLQGFSSHFKAGYYQIHAGESATQFLQRIIEGDVLTENFQIIEGSNLMQISDHLSRAAYLIYHPDDWKVVQGNYPNAEGLLLADTYHYVAGSSAKQLLQTANKNLEAYLEQCWKNRDPGLPYKNAYELLVVASILEKESGLADERKIISGVVINRLRKNMPLQMDPTVIYAFGSAYSGKLSHNSMKIDSPYNTYRYRGLPPTPIAMVGKTSLDAAAHPQPNDYLYFVAKGDGSHVFSRTYEEQREAISRYLHGED